MVLPTNCVLCDALGSTVCLDCQAKISLNPVVVQRMELSGFRICTYSKSAAQLVHEYKEANQASIARSFARAMYPAILKYNLSQAVLVPMPSKRQSFASRGFNPADEICKSLARTVAREMNLLLPIYRGLEIHRTVQDQAALSGEYRRLNLVGAMRLTRALPAREAILIDDVVTTGATLSEAKRCLEQAGGRVLGFVAFAETLPKNKQKRHEESF